MSKNSKKLPHFPVTHTTTPTRNDDARIVVLLTYLIHLFWAPKNVSGVAKLIFCRPVKEVRLKTN
jgi:hypothetical protein